MIYLAQPAYLFLLLVIPLLFVGYALWLSNRRKKIEKIGDPALVERLMPDASTGKGWLKITLLALAWLFFTIGLARPQTGARLKEHESKGAEVMIALDVSNSMLAEDYSPNRLERSKLAISRFVDRLTGDRVGLVVFAGQAFVQLPITTDYVSAKIFLNSTNTGSVPVQGTALADAISTCAMSFSTQSEKSRAIILITDGEDHEGDVLEVAKSVAETGIRIYCVGVGSPAGKPIPYEGGLMKDKDGNIVVSKLDEDILVQIAGIGNGKYVRAGNGEFGLNPIIEDIRSLEKEAFSSVVFEDFNEQYMYFFALALFFLLLEALVPQVKARRNIFSKDQKR
ncbi:MAG: VWA domain-containing protein [Bacteroidales bacterium]|nr:VWA domain-containing protein [Bacteroidales bacterium]